MQENVAFLLLAFDAKRGYFFQLKAESSLFLGINFVEI